MSHEPVESDNSSAVEAAALGSGLGVNVQLLEEREADGEDD